MQKLIKIIIGVTLAYSLAQWLLNPDLRHRDDARIMCQDFKGSEYQECFKSNLKALEASREF